MPCLRLDSMEKPERMLEVVQESTNSVSCELVGDAFDGWRIFVCLVALPPSQCLNTKSYTLP